MVLIVTFQTRHLRAGLTQPTSSQFSLRTLHTHLPLIKTDLPPAEIIIQGQELTEKLNPDNEVLCVDVKSRRGSHLSSDTIFS